MVELNKQKNIDDPEAEIQALLQQNTLIEHKINRLRLISHIPGILFLILAALIIIVFLLVAIFERYYPVIVVPAADVFIDLKYGSRSPSGRSSYDMANDYGFFMLDAFIRLYGPYFLIALIPAMGIGILLLKLSPLFRRKKTDAYNDDITANNYRIRMLQKRINDSKE